VAPCGQLNLLSYVTSLRLRVFRIIAQINGPSLKEEEVQSLKNKYPEAFSGKLGKLKNQSIKLDIDETIRPIKQITREIEKCRGKRAVGYGEIRYY